MNFIALDFETANFKRQSVCAIGLAIVENNEIVKTIYKLIKPTPNYYENINMSIHGIKPEMTENEKTFDELWDEIKIYFENKTIVAHNAAFDLSALRYVLDSYNIPYPTLGYYCSMLTSKNMYSGLTNYQLPTICKHFNINNLSHHNAVSDATACAQIMLEILKDKKLNSLEELEKKFNFRKGVLYRSSYNPFSCCGRKPLPYKTLFEIKVDETSFDEEHPFYQKRVVFTGTLSNLGRTDAKSIVERIGGIVNPENLNSKTNYLVVGTYDYTQYGEGYKSGKLKKAEELIAQGKDLEIISENNFFSMIHSEDVSFEITLEQIENDSKKFLERNKYNDFSGKNIYFSSDLSLDRLEVFQMVGYCSGYGHDYDVDEIANSDFFVISTKLIEDLRNGIKGKVIIDFEHIRNKTQKRGDLKAIKLISEKCFLEYIERRKRFQNGEIKMNIFEPKIKNNVP